MLNTTMKKESRQDIYEVAIYLKENIHELCQRIYQLEKEKRLLLSKIVLNYFGPHYIEEEQYLFFSYIGNEKVIIEGENSSSIITLNEFIEEHIPSVNLYFPSTSLLMERLEEDLK